MTSEPTSRNREVRFDNFYTPCVKSDIVSFPLSCKILLIFKWVRFKHFEMYDPIFEEVISWLDRLRVKELSFEHYEISFAIFSKPFELISLYSRNKLKEDSYSHFIISNTNFTASSDLIPLELISTSKKVRC